MQYRTTQSTPPPLAAPCFRALPGQNHQEGLLKNGTHYLHYQHILVTSFTCTYTYTCMYVSQQSTDISPGHKEKYPDHVPLMTTHQCPAGRVCCRVCSRRPTAAKRGRGSRLTTESDAVTSPTGGESCGRNGPFGKIPKGRTCWPKRCAQ